MCPPWPIVAFGNVLLPQPLHSAGRELAGAVRVVIQGWEVRQSKSVTSVTGISEMLPAVPVRGWRIKALRVDFFGCIADRQPEARKD